MPLTQHMYVVRFFACLFLTQGNKAKQTIILMNLIILEVL